MYRCRKCCNWLFRIKPELLLIRLNLCIYWFIQFWVIFVGHDRNKSEPINLLRFSIVKCRKCCNWLFRIKTELPLIIDWIYAYIDLIFLIRHESYPPRRVTREHHFGGWNVFLMHCGCVQLRGQRSKDDIWKFGENRIGSTVCAPQWVTPKYAARF